jgi:prephenate dehydrogenase
LTLGLTVLDIEKDEEQIYNLASSGFASTARLAKSSSQMWAPIFEQNSNYLPKAIDQFIDYLKQFKKAIEQNDQDAMIKLMDKANDIRRILHEINGDS